MTEFRSIIWRDSDARLKEFSASARSSGKTEVRIVIEVTDPFRLGVLLQELSEIKRDQGKQVLVAEPVKPRDSRKALSSSSPLLLTHRKST